MTRDRIRAVSKEFTADGLRLVRDLVEQTAHAAGVSAANVHCLVISVSELAANAVRHGGGRGRIVIEQTDDGLRVEVSDHGPGLPADLPQELPPPDAVNGRGLWMVRRLCRDLHISSTADGVTVRLSMPRAESAA
ncbi:ATP-binding protein [Dactylosporangium aurantiacum]|uniref:ATP-binding protein n=1 Tax=Dactylosporangium aurantiacum TaxID=35754 RepID=A0A9Q9IL85_9ACTN|nr:ATP-binding protein [Dactylosporangium aurantiacum]MDG6103206.1 ATP-binding protein [Dactylosporangium aurantiacum]UWZ57711.1 ATP-binding protein [Dactylosporangium aurantiacum]